MPTIVRSCLILLMLTVLGGCAVRPQGIADLDAREWITFLPLVLATLIMGLAPSYVLDFTRVSAEAVVAAYAGGAP